MFNIKKENFITISLTLVLIHGIIWISLPLIFDGSIRRDVAEGVVDGPLWQIAYLRHPPLSSWLSGLASQAGPFRYAALYFFSWILSSGAFLTIGIFLARKISPLVGMVALLSGLMSPFATYISLNLNHNITLMFFTAACLFAIWNAFEKNDLQSWLIAGLITGLTFWAKYAILLMVGPLGLFMFVQPDLRRKLATPGPWLALVVALVVASPQFYHNIFINRSAVQFAINGNDRYLDLLERILYTFEFLLNITLTQIPFIFFAFLYGGASIFRNAWHSFSNFRRTTLFSQYLTIAAFAPIFLIVISTLLSRQPYFLWVTALSVPLCAYWAFIASQSEPADSRREKMILKVALIYACFNAVAFSSVRLIAPFTSKIPMNQEIDSVALAQLAQNYWLNYSREPIPFMVNLGTQRGFQRAAGIIFDLPYRVELLAYGDHARSPWLNTEKFQREGALVVSDQPISTGSKILGQSVEDIATYDLPTLRGARTAKIYFARSIPNSP